MDPCAMDKCNNIVYSILKGTGYGNYFHLDGLVLVVLDHGSEALWHGTVEIKFSDVLD